MPRCIYVFSCWTLFPVFHNSKQCCSEHCLFVYVSLHPCWVSIVYIHRRYSWMVGNTHLQLWNFTKSFFKVVALSFTPSHPIHMPMGQISGCYTSLQKLSKVRVLNFGNLMHILLLFAFMFPYSLGSWISFQMFYWPFAFIYILHCFRSTLSVEI